MAQIDTVNTLFEPFEAGADPFPSVAVPTRPEAGQQAAILECYEHLFRDWVWGEHESELALGFLAPLVPEGLSRRRSTAPARAGWRSTSTGRRVPARTFALDVNPLPFLVTSRLLVGETVRLPEFPLDPISEEVVVVDRELSFPHGEPASRSSMPTRFVPPFPPGSLDAVVTSWFIDVARADLRTTAAVINRVLRPGGLWVNLGPLRFHSELPAPTRSKRCWTSWAQARSRSPRRTGRSCRTSTRR